MKNNKKNIITFLSLIIIFIGYISPPLVGLNKDATTIVFTFFGILLLWLFVSIEWPSLLLIFILGTLPSIGFKSAISLSLGNETFMFLMTTFLCTHSLAKTNFIKRCAVIFISSKIAKKSFFHLAVMFFSSVLFIGLFISPTVLFIVFLPILNEIYSFIGIKKYSKISEMLMIGLAFSTSISSGMTPISHVFSTLAMGFYTNFTGYSINYFKYMSVAIPIGLICFTFMIILFKVFYKNDIKNFNKNYKYNINIKLNKPNKKEIYCISVFFFVVSLWILPSLTTNIFPNLSSLINGYGIAMPPTLGAILLSIISVDNKPCLNFKEATSTSIPWGSLLMASSALALGSTFTNKEIGINIFLTNNFQNITQNLLPIVIIFIIISWTALQTNLSSNIVTVTVVSNVAIPLALSLNNTINPVSITILIGMISSFAFSTPPSIPHIAIAGSSEFCTSKNIFVLGIILTVISIFVSVFIGYPLGNIVS
ncbi:MAG: SLC13 family permease [Oscillospiraceae bacterium]